MQMIKGKLLLQGGQSSPRKVPVCRSSCMQHAQTPAPPYRHSCSQVSQCCVHPHDTA